jgi:hypothetical protein
MIRFFRSIRQNLLAQGRITRYLTYAVGEILLVMVGILLALQVNNWNEGRKRSLFEQEILSLIDQNLESDSLALSNERSKTIQAIALTDRLLQRVAKKHYSDSLNHWMGKIIYFERFKSRSSGFEVLRSKGFETIANKKLQLALISYYDESLFNLDQSLNDLLQSFNTDWIPVIKEDFTDFRWAEYCEPTDPQQFFEKPSSIILFKLYKDNRAGQLRRMNNALDQISQIRKLTRPYRT